MNRDDILPLIGTLQRVCQFGSPEARKQIEEYNQIRDQIRHRDEAELFYGLYPLAIQNEFETPAGFAVSLLFELNPTCQISCEEAIRGLLSEWNVSTQRLPFYLVNQFGKSRMRDAIQQIRVSPLTKDEKSLLDTVEYWTNLAKGGD